LKTLQLPSNRKAVSLSPTQLEYIIYDHKKNYVHQKVPSNHYNLRSENCT